MAHTDHDLMRLVQSRQGEALSALKRRHEGTLRLHLLRYVDSGDAQDLLQETWVRAWERSGQWDGSGAPLAWLLRIATNLALNHIRDSRLRAHGNIDDEIDEYADEPTRQLEASGPGVPEQAHLRDQAERLLELIAQMPEDRQALLRMARLEQRRLQDIADQAGVPVGTIKSRLHSATRWLAARWDDD